MKKKATVICWISTTLASLALCLTCGLPLPAGIPPMLLQWLILPLLALLTAANLFRLGGTSDRFIHTRHTGASDAAPEKTDTNP